MFRLLIDTCVWLDVAKDPHQHSLVSALEELTSSGVVSLLVPRVVVNEFRRNRERVAKESAKSLSATFKRVRDAVDKHGDPSSKRHVMKGLDDVGHKIPLLGGAAEGILDRVDQLLEASAIIETTDEVKLRAAERALDGRAPFHRNKNSLADAVIIETYATCLKERHTRFAFVTHNTHDFSDPIGNNTHPHPDFAPLFSKVKSLYFVRLRDALLRVQPDVAGDALLAHEWIEEPRPLSEIHGVVNELWDKVWYNRHQVWMEKIARGEVKLVAKETFPITDHVRRPIQRDVWKGARATARRKEKQYGKRNLGPWSDFEWGMLNGKLSALRWALGEDWESSLDT